MHTDLMIKPNAIFHLQWMVLHFALCVVNYKGVDGVTLQSTIRQGRLLARIGRIPVVGSNPSHRTYGDGFSHLSQTTYSRQ